MRVYIPATVGYLRSLEEDGILSVRSGYGFAVTAALRESYESGEEEDFEEIAFDEAARASIRLLALYDEEYYPHRRVVISVDLPDANLHPDPDLGEAVVRVDPPRIHREDLAAIHVDAAGSEEATAKAIKVIDEADLGDEIAELAVGDAIDNYMAWYDPSELPVLIDLL
ncbi:hypothetical protein N7326_02665 [Corynebacterium sp. ES2794-CONJ1]|uniref:DUF6912 family protein n=1 Tax=unclassified Corynebacterium TaxID=2624378 RepID=UPI00216A61B1|nr:MULTISPECIES: hypothetical protein [unclassified Corynebacterium]MCS4489477.1 hypothetical protein [Corynebacterium sp. ES2775-CONJ]MCS4491512.1 hypothetical protein [Corynebacterium sp. ES2715-CONJ3]MCS4531388.1 hypothetical protein [Corynebacterium sp. ES2730-CONJ]MCU9518775.1 hypothetical protein [Corynebacterium sp. ES2794-CONJ1]